MGYIAVAHDMVHKEGETYKCMICKEEYTIQRDRFAKEQLRNTPLPNGIYFQIFNPTHWLLEEEAGDYIKNSSIPCSLRSLYK